jgi:hypothetical protein
VRYFFYGTLIDPQVLHAVLRHPVPASRRRNATLPGYRRVFRRNADYPILVPDPAGIVDGIIVNGLTVADTTRLAAYEGPEYLLACLPVRTAGGASVRAAVFLPDQTCPASAREWTLDEWRQRYRARFLRRVRARHIARPTP